LLLWLALLLPLGSTANLALHHPGEAGGQHRHAAIAGEPAGLAGHAGHQGGSAPKPERNQPAGGGMLCIMCVAFGGPSLPGAPPAPLPTTEPTPEPAPSARLAAAPVPTSRRACAQGCRGPPAI